MRHIYIILLFLLAGFSSFAQEILTGLQVNPVVRMKALEYSSDLKRAATADTTPVRLPFFDDFSVNSVYPSPSRWIDRYAYVNDDFPLFPYDRGAATLDAISDSGFMYPDAVAGPSTFIADHLTSRYIRLDSVFSPVPHAMSRADSLFLSFYYQPQGRGMAPEESDSLVLRFLVHLAYDSITPTDTIHIEERWKTVWISPGMSLDSFHIENHVYFKRVMIPISDSLLFYKKFFRFQFYNHVSLTSDAQPSWQSNTDEWNIDDVYLNTGRSMSDTIQPSLKFIERAPSFLAHYTSMPNNQYMNDPTDEMADSLFILAGNRDTVAHASTYSYSVTQVGGTFARSYSEPDTVTSWYHNNSLFPIRPQVNFLFPLQTGDSISFFTRHILKDNTPGSTLGDTIESYQNFYNYFAYDDGTPELGYGLKGTGAMLAYRFDLNQSPDTLRGVRFFFNRTLSEANQQLFYIAVWNDFSGKPGDTLFTDLVIVRYPDTLNKFVTYVFPKPVRVSGTFYVGTIQTTDDNLNIGFDAYNDAHERMMYNTTGVWLTSSFTGSLMIRPLLGKPLPLGIPASPELPGALTVYPNPAGNVIHIGIPGYTDDRAEAANISLHILNMFGQEVFSGSYSPEVNLPELPSGIYLMKLDRRGDGQSWTGKLLINR
jgi:hypothetical protein